MVAQYAQNPWDDTSSISMASPKPAVTSISARFGEHSTRSGAWRNPTIQSTELYLRLASRCVNRFGVNRSNASQFPVSGNKRNRAQVGFCGGLSLKWPFLWQKTILVGEIGSFRGWSGKRVFWGLFRQGEGWSSHERGDSWYVLLKPLVVECEMLGGVTRYIPWISSDVSVCCGFSRSVNMMLPLGNVSCYSLGESWWRLFLRKFPRMF